METEGDNKNIGECELHETPKSTEQGNGSTNNSHMEAHPSSSLSPSQNPSIEPSDATNNTGNGCMENDTLSINHVACESSPGNPFHEPANTDKTSSTCETSENDGQISSMTIHGHDQGLEIQNPQVQVMERPGEPSTSPQYIFPPHVFSQSNANSQVEWSTASNESLFSIYMGNTSFSSELTCLKSCEFDKNGKVFMHDESAYSSSSEPPTPVNKFNDINKRTAEQKLHMEENSKATEAKVAETMREVIMESSRSRDNVGNVDDKVSNSHRQSDSSAHSYAFQLSKDQEKNVSSKRVAEKQNQQEQAEENETPNTTDQAPKTTTNAAPNKWLNCFSCCTFC